MRLCVSWVVCVWCDNFYASFFLFEECSEDVRSAHGSVCTTFNFNVAKLFLFPFLDILSLWFAKKVHPSSSLYLCSRTICTSHFDSRCGNDMAVTNSHSIHTEHIHVFEKIPRETKGERERAYVIELKMLRQPLCVCTTAVVFQLNLMDEFVLCKYVLKASCSLLLPLSSV